MENQEKIKTTWKGWLSLTVLIMVLSGVFTKSSGPLAALDFTNLCGQFGNVFEKVNFIGKGGTGARDGFMAGLNLLPPVMLFCGLLGVFEEWGAFDACRVLFKPLLRPLLGLPGTTGIAFISSFTGSDVAAVMTKDLYENNEITDDERTIFVAYQYAASAVINNTISGGAPMLAISPVSFGVVFAVEFICKIIGANIIRVVLAFNRKKGVKGNE
jgi:nucleoside recognition membrane protein YjiH